MRQAAACMRPGYLGSDYLAEYPVSNEDQQVDTKEGAQEKGRHAMIPLQGALPVSKSLMTHRLLVELSLLLTASSRSGLHEVAQSLHVKF